MHDEYTKLVNTVRQQNAKICGVEKQLGTVITLLQSINNSSVQQRQQISQQQDKISGLETQLTTVLSLSECISSVQQKQQQSLCQATSETTITGTSGSTQRRSFANVTGQRSCEGRRRDTNRVVWGQKDSTTTENNEFTVENDNNLEHDSHFTMIVHRTLNDVSRRRKNIVISGLPEQDGEGIDAVDDKTAFLEFCAGFLPVKPALAEGNCCQRIGRVMLDRPRRLLIRLNSEESAAELLRVAPTLRNAVDEYIAKNVYINADMSPSAAKLEYEVRKKRREQRNRRFIQDSTSVSGSGSGPVEEYPAFEEPPSSDQLLRSDDYSGLAAVAAFANSQSGSAGGSQPSDINSVGKPLEAVAMSADAGIASVGQAQSGLGNNLRSPFQ